jgi:predicted AlkP superfamily phosphohydrolase/phosphomutase
MFAAGERRRGARLARRVGRRARLSGAVAIVLVAACGPASEPTRTERRHASLEAFLTSADGGAAGRRLVVIGLDGASWDYLRPRFREGELPNLARITREGVVGTLRSVECYFTPPAWTTLFTGVLPERHGVYTFGRWNAAEREFSESTSADVGAPTLWDLASRAERRVAAVGVPVTYPATPVEGVMVSGLMTPKRHGPPLAVKPMPDRPVPPDPTLETFSLPLSAAFEDPSNVFLARFVDTEDDGETRYDRVRLRVLKKGIGPPEKRVLGTYDFPVGDFSPWLRVRVAGPVARRDAWARIRFDRPSETGVDFRLSPTFERIRHPFTHPRELAAELQERFGYYLPHEFLSLDLLPEITADAAEHARFFLAREPWDVFLYVFGQSDNAHHVVGFAESVLPIYREIDDFLGELLDEADDDTVVVLASDHGFGAFDYAVDPNQLLARKGLLHWSAPGVIDHDRTLVFHNLWHFYFAPRLLSREELVSHGVPIEATEEPRAALERYLTRIFRELRSDDGEPFPVDVVPLPPDAMGDAPDMAVRGSDRYWIEFWNVDRPSGAIVRPLVGDERWKHARDGILAFWSADVQSGRDLGVVDIQDVTPTLLDLLGLPVAEDLDGRVIPGVLSAEIDRGRVLHRIATYGPPTPVETLESDDPASFEEKLRALGYLRD